MKSIAIIASPLQAVNVLEYCLRFEREVDLVILEGVSDPQSPSRFQIEGVLALLKPRLTVYVEELRVRKLHKARSDLASGLALVKRQLSPEPYEVVVGEYQSSLSWALLRSLGLGARTIVVVDDGTATLLINRRQRIPRSRQGWRQELKKGVFRLVGIRSMVPAAGLTFFTAYSIDDRIAEGDTIIRNDYRNLKGLLRDLVPDDDSVYVIGGDVTGPQQRGGSGSDYELELALDLARFAAAYSGKQVIYLAHRHEQAEKLDVLRRDFTVATPTVPFEIFPLTVGKRPRVIVAYFSSVLVTAGELLGESVDLVALQLPRDRLKKSWIPIVDGIYDYFQKEMPAVRLVEQPWRVPRA